MYRVNWLDSGNAGALQRSMPRVPRCKKGKSKEEDDFRQDAEAAHHLPGHCAGLFNHTLRSGTCQSQSPKPTVISKALAEAASRSFGACQEHPLGREASCWARQSLRSCKADQRSSCMTCRKRCLRYGADFQARCRSRPVETRSHFMPERQSPMPLQTDTSLSGSPPPCGSASSLRYLYYHHGWPTLLPLCGVCCSAACGLRYWHHGC